MKNKVIVTIAGQEYTMVAVEDEAYVRKCAAHVDGQLHGLLSGRLSRADAAVLAGFGVIDKDAFMENLLDGLSLHDFAGGLIRSYAAYKGHDLQQIDSIEGLRRLLQKDLWEK